MKQQTIAVILQPFQRTSKTIFPGTVDRFVSLVHAPSNSFFINCKIMIIRLNATFSPIYSTFVYPLSPSLTLPSIELHEPVLR